MNGQIKKYIAIMPRTNGKAKRRVAMAVILIVLIAIISGLTIYSNSPNQQLKKRLTLGEKYLEELNYEQALVAFETALNIDKKNIKALEGTSSAYIGIAQNSIETDAIIEAYRNAITYNPKNEIAYSELADVYVDKRQYEEAVALLTEGYNNIRSKNLENKLAKVKAEYMKIKEKEMIAKEKTEPKIFECYFLSNIDVYEDEYENLNAEYNTRIPTYGVRFEKNIQVYDNKGISTTISEAQIMWDDPINIDLDNLVGHNVRIKGYILYEPTGRIYMDEEGWQIFNPNGDYILIMQEVEIMD